MKLIQVTSWATVTLRFVSPPRSIEHILQLSNAPLRKQLVNLLRGNINHRELSCIGYQAVCESESLGSESILEHLQHLHSERREIRPARFICQFT
ncbi:hypothetical protein FIBSPDRAFT_461821 [Athelia psychrophila]|uniref:Uncharacterized protein n=1 Tax=Athelia psychrophila TaxID=1759441 RepID=A0A166LWD1_9AGAM|nr:hypothetical protein FIBSPDRAFT_461821 [Fibularhizoctonia sp. CBS 109695]